MTRTKLENTSLSAPIIPQKFSPENIAFPKTKSVIFPILNFFYFPSTQIDFFVG